MIPLTGYVDRLSVRPDETVSFHVSHHAPADNNNNNNNKQCKIQVQIVRVISADPHRNPGPGIQTQAISPAQQGGGSDDDDAPAVQCVREPGPSPSQLGAHAEIPLPSTTSFTEDGFTFVSNIFPTATANHNQTIASVEASFDFYVDATTGCLGLSLYGKKADSTKTRIVVCTGQKKLPLHQWCQVGCSVDALSGMVSIAWSLLRNQNNVLCRSRGASDYEIVTGADKNKLLGGAGTSKSSTPQDCSLFLAAIRQTDNTDGTSCFACHFNGRMEHPRLWKTSVTLQDLFPVKRAAEKIKPTSDEMVAPPDAAWDFGQKMTSQTIHDTGPNHWHGRLVNMPTRAVRGSNWTGREMCWRHAPDEYAAIHFHASDFGNCQWPVCYQWRVPKNLKSGNYALLLDACDDKKNVREYGDNIPFFVLPPKGEKQADLVLIVPTFTYVVYSNHGRGEWVSNPKWPGAWKTQVEENSGAYPYQPREHPEYGWSTYNNHVDGSGVSLTTWLRPILNLRIGYITFPFPETHGSGLRHYPADSHLTWWLESQGIEYDVVTDWELHFEGSHVLEPYRVAMTGTHPEYHTEESWNAMRDYRNNGGRFCYMGGNGFYWKIALDKENGIMEIRRGEGGIRAWAAEAGEYYQQLDGGYGGLWRRSGRAPQALVGVGFTAQGNFVGSWYRLKQDALKDPRTAWMFEGITQEVIGNHGLSGHGAAGYELDRIDYGLGTPNHAIVVAASEGHDPDVPWVLVFEEQLTHLGNIVGVPDKTLIRSDITFFETPNGGVVFSVGSICFCGSLWTNEGKNEISTLIKNVITKFLDANCTFKVPE